MSSRIYDQKNVSTAKRSTMPAAPASLPSNENVQRNDALCCARFSFDSCFLATKNNHIDCLIRAHRAGCPLGKNVVEMAKQLQHMECWIYAKLNINTTL